MTSGRAVAAAAALFVSAAGGPAAALELAFPLACELGVDCWLQQGPDRDPGPGALDHACGPHAYDGHQGVDIRLADRVAILADIAVLAPAPGRVTARRDGLPDGGGFPEGQDCGNGVVLDHGGGWETQFCHLREGSVAVEEGRRVATGDVLGAVGLSGRTEFPHLHVSVRLDGRAVDPADGRPLDSPCGAGGASLWAPEAGLGGPPGGIHALGLRSEAPDYDAVRGGLAQARVLPARGPALVLWTALHAMAPGDRVDLRLTGPGGEVVARSATMDRARAERFLFAGRRAPVEGFPPGRYEGEARLLRDDVVIDVRRLAVELR